MTRAVTDALSIARRLIVVLEEHSWETVVELIGHTRTATGLRVRVQLDKRRYPLGTVISNADMRALELREHAFHGDWNYEVAPRRS